MQNFLLFFNIISFDFYTLSPTLLKLFYRLEKVESFKAFKILIHILILFIRRKSLFPEPDFGVEK